MAKSSVIGSRMPVINTQQQTQKAGAGNTTKVHSLQTQCAAHVVVEAQVQQEVMQVVIREVHLPALVNVTLRTMHAG